MVNQLGEPTQKAKAIRCPHIVSASASKNRLCLGQVKVNEKSSEIKAIPELLKLLAIEDSIVTIDAIGCQTDIAEKITKGNVDYLITVKGNQSNLEQAIVDTIMFEKPAYVDRHDDFGHGRIESRACSVYTELSHVENIKKWNKLKTIIKIESEIYYKSTSKTSTEERFYISSLPADAKKNNSSVRKHWSVENNLHWTLDVEFGEEKSRKRNGYVAENFNITLKTALVMLTKETSFNKSKKNK